jgi:putative cell wall-binding protein
MFSSIRYFFSDVAYWLRAHAGRSGVFAGIALVVIGGAFVVYAGVKSLSKDKETVTAPAPAAVVKTETRVVEPKDLGFPAFATRNTTRVSGADPAADAAGVALATFPSSASGRGPTAVSLVNGDDWADAIAASSLIAEPTRIPILLSDGDQLGELTTNAIEALAPQGSPATDQAQLLEIGSAPSASGLKTKKLGGADDAETAAAIAEERAALTGSDPDHVIVTSLDESGYAMPAAAWAARSGDPVLFTEKDSVPQATLDVIKKFKSTPVYVLGPESVVSAKAVKQLAKVAVDVQQVGEEGPVENAIAFARYSDGDFGWNINDPGHGFVIANSHRPSDAGGAAGLSGSGNWGPLLITDDAEKLPKPLGSYLLDLKPGYADDPTRAVYNHVWVIGDESALSVPAQARVDELAELAQISSPSTTPAPAGGTPPKQSDQGKDQAANK